MLKKLQALFAPRDLTVGNTLSGIVMFAIPLLIGNLAQQLYNTVDAIVVGQYVGDAALGAVGLAGPIINLILVLFMGISTGATIVVSQYFGAKDRRNLSKAVGTTIMLTVVSGVVMSVIGALHYETQVAEAAAAFAEALCVELPDGEVLGPADCVRAKVKDRYRKHVLVKCAPEADLGGALARAAAASGRAAGVSVALDVDAHDMM